MEPAAERWDQRHASRVRSVEPAAFVVDASAWIVPDGMVLDVAGGAGRNAVWLASRGFEVTLVDVSEVAAELARDHARTAGVPLQALVRDVEADGLPPGPWDAIVIHHFLDRPTLEAAPDFLGTGGVLVFCQPTRRNLERNERPGERWLLAEGELADWVAGRDSRLEVLQLDERWFDNGRHEARLVARRRGPQPGGTRVV